MSGVLVNMIVNTYNEEDHTALVKINNEIYYVDSIVNEGELSLSEEIGIVQYWDQEYPEREFSSNSYALKKGEIYSVLDRSDIYVIPFVDEDYSTKYRVLEKLEEK